MKICYNLFLCFNACPQCQANSFGRRVIIFFMSMTLYRKYRPQKFSDLVGQNHIKITLQNEVEGGKVSHAYLFTGPRGVGKTTTARILAKALNCENLKKGEHEPCGKCSACEDIAAGRAMDIIEIDAASHTGVDNVRENVIENARVAPSKLKYKVFIIDEVHMLSTSAFNALLKTLEEPPANVILILATTEVHKVPATIVSRTERYDFKRINLEDLKSRLKDIVRKEKIQVPDSILDSISRKSEGCLRDAESLLGQVLSLAGGQKKISEEHAEIVIPKSNFTLVAELIGYLTDKKAKEGLAMVNNLINEGVDLPQFISEAIEFLRKILLVKISGELSQFSYELDRDSEKKLRELSGKLDILEILRIINIFIEKQREVKTAEIVQLPLEIAVADICSFEDDRYNVTEQSKNLPTPEKSQPATKEEEKSSVEVKKNDNKESKKPSGKKIKIKFDEINGRWGEVLAAVEKYNHSLPFIMNVSKPVSLKNDILEIAFQYKIHADRLKEQKSREVVERVLEEIFKEKIFIESVLGDSKDFEDFKPEKPEVREEENNSEPDEGDEAIANVLKEFGGKVVD